MGDLKILLTYLDHTLPQGRSDLPNSFHIIIELPEKINKRHEQPRGKQTNTCALIYFFEVSDHALFVFGQLQGCNKDQKRTTKVGPYSATCPWGPQRLMWSGKGTSSCLCEPAARLGPKAKVETKTD